MFREMRRKEQQLSKDTTERILAAGRTGILGVMGDDEYPYTVPVNYVYDHGKIFFHSATTGHKLDGIQRNNKVSFCVIEKDEIVPEKFATDYRSAIAFGKASIVTDEALKNHTLELIVQKYSPGLETEGADEIRRGWEIVCIVEIAIDHVTGKEAIGA